MHDKKWWRENIKLFIKTSDTFYICNWRENRKNDINDSVEFYTIHYCNVV